MERIKGMNNETPDTQIRAMLKGLSRKDFLQIGLDEIAYVRPVSIGQGADKTAYAIHAADGTRISVFETRDIAAATIENNDLIQVTLH